jgi:uncharacterized pyridoxamine 5'-phosphate oxidase family protein
MNEVIQFLNENQNGFLATVDQEGKPRVRPFGFMFEQEGKLYFCTSNQKKVFAEMQAQPWVEYSMMSPQFAWLRIFGKAVFTSDLSLKAKVIESNPMVKGLYKTPDNPTLEVFYLDEADAGLFDFSGQPPKKFKL